MFLVAFLAAVSLHDIPHERVDYWVAEFSKDHEYHKKIAAGFARMPKYQKMIERKLRERGMPRNLIWLAMEESAFKSEVSSRQGAVGIWRKKRRTPRSIFSNICTSVSAAGISRRRHTTPARTVSRGS